MKGYGPETFGEHMADVYDSMFGTRLADATTADAVELLAELAAGGRVLELAIGTGRVALPLAAKGVEVHGIDASEAMIAKLREKPGGDAIPMTIGDFADVAVEGEFDLVFLVFNTLFNLTTQDDQVRCFQNVARRLRRGGAFVLEAFVPDFAGYVDDRAVRAANVEAESVTLEASVHDPVEQVVHYQYIAFSREGTTLYPLPMRYAWPSELDLMARLAGLELRDRWSDWKRSAFTAASRSHVSLYALP
ncbi:MAG: class I SAM-dependent methyltransferase [Myxococcota bacterium]|nr:class I SAM-dependent methyltransferase [Myxococcota bacterium]